MKTLALATACAVALVLSSFAAHADQLKVKASALAPKDAELLRGKSVAVVLHERESYVWMTPGKAMFGMLGVAAMVKGGNDFVEQNQIPDPTILIREQLAGLLRDRFGAQPAATDTTVTKSNKPAELTKAHPESDYILSIRHLGTMSGYYPASFGTYWISNTFAMQLVDAKSGRVLGKGNCFASTHKNPVRPSAEMLRADKAQLAKDILTSLTWRCTRQLALDAFKVSPELAPTIPAEFVDPLARVSVTAAATASAAKNAQPAPTPASPSAPAASSGQEPTAPTADEPPAAQGQP